MDRLPAEVKCTVVRYLANTIDRKALVLVNKAWAGIVAPVLWEILTTDLVQSDQRHPLGLAHPKSNIVKHTRMINLLALSTTRDIDHLPILLAAIPRGQLQSFKSDGEILPSTSSLLLLLHLTLQVFSMRRSSGIAHAF
jgi:hypothetical protein